GPLTYTSLPLSSPATQFELSLLAAELPDGLALSLQWATDLWDEATALRFVDAFGRFLAAMAADPSLRVSQLPLLSAAERHQLRCEWNATPAPREVPLVPAAIARWATIAPDAPALSYRGETIGYQALDERAGRVAVALAARGVAREEIVALCLPRGPALVTAALGVMRSGAAYLPLDPAHPPERLAATLADAGARFILTEGGRPLSGTTAEALDPAALWAGESAGDGCGRPTPDLAPDRLAYVIYTSGSTGAPKGSLLTHGGLANLVAWNRETFAVGPADRAAQVAAPGFDASVWEIWSSLAAGACLLFPPAEALAEPRALFAWLGAERATLCFLPTPLMELALAEEAHDTELRWLFVGGDRLQRRPSPALR